MRIRIICMGKVREPYLTDGISDYLKRLRPFANLVIVDLPDEKVPDRASDAEIRKLTEKEGLRMLNAVNPDDSVIAPMYRGRNGRVVILHAILVSGNCLFRGISFFVSGGALVFQTQS